MFQIVIWDYYQRSKGKKLFNQNETLEAAQLTMDQEVLCCLYFFSQVLNYLMFSLKSLTRHLIVACFVVTIACIFFLCGLFYMPSVLWYQIVKFNSTDCCNPTMCFLPAWGFIFLGYSLPQVIKLINYTNHVSDLKPFSTIC